MPDLDLTSLTKHFRGVTAVDGVTLHVEDGEFLCLLGPSGCGKTTTLRLIAGFETADAGSVRLGGQDITNMPANHRDIGVVFQSYALFPHLTVNENIGFGLRMRKKPKAEIATAVKEALRLVQLDHVGERLPKQLSGGQQQRVALARAIAIRPRLLLLDEPLSNLDAKLRDEMRSEIQRVQRAVGITTIFVTHDQLEALALSDRMAVMDQGRIVQLGAPMEIYERPAHPFVAGFIGQANLLQGRVTAIDGGTVRFETRSGLAVLGEGTGFAVGDPVLGVVKTERIGVHAAARLDVSNQLPMRVEQRTYLGAVIQYICTAGEERLTVLQPNAKVDTALEIGDTAIVAWRASDCLLLPARGGGA